MTQKLLPNRTGRGGRLPGSKNKRTLYREQQIKAADAGKTLTKIAHDPNEIVKINGADFIAQSLNAMGEALGFFLQMARGEADPKQRRVYYHDVLTAGEKIAPFYRPKLASIHTTTHRQSALDRPGTVEREMYAQLMAEIAQSGELPRQVKAYLANGGGSNGGGTGKIGGVANRDAD
jgi:hypothetical protein